MSDSIAGRPAGAREGGGGPWNEGAPPPVLLAALGAALLIAVTLIAMFGGFGGGGDDEQAVPVSGTSVVPSATGGVQRFELTVSLEGSGRGKVRIEPGDISCRRSCERDFASGTRVTVTAEPASGSTFEGWGDSCDGTARCSVLMDGARSVSAAFDSAPAEPLCDDAAAEDPACAGENLDARPDENLDTPGDTPLPANDCGDGRDNDRDGLTDAAQDPDCADGGAEAGSAAPGAAAPPPRPPNDCADGRDNDRDGLTDRAQDPDCAGGRTETG